MKTNTRVIKQVKYMPDKIFIETRDTISQRAVTGTPFELTLPIPDDARALAE